MAYVPAVNEFFGTEVSQIEAHAERAAERVAAERAKLTRPDSSPVYGPAEQAERDAAILEVAGAALDQATARYATQAEREIEDTERKLAMLAGADPYDRLGDTEKQAAATRQPFVKEDCETLPASELARQARAAIASGDKPRAYLYGRYLGRRVDSEARAGRATSIDPELSAVVRELGAVFDDGTAAEKRRELGRRLEGAKSLRWKADTLRKSFDGTMERIEAGMRRQFSLV